MRRSSPHSDKNYFWTRKDDDDGNATVLTVVSSLDNSTPSKFTTKNVFRLNKSSHDEKKIYFGPSSSKNPCGVRIYIKNENNITNYNTGPPIPPPTSKSREYAEPIIMPSFNTRRNRSNSFKSSIDTDSDSKPKTFASTQRAMSFLKKDLLSNRNDFAFLKKPVVHSNKDPPIFQPLKTQSQPPPIVSPRRSEFLTDFPVIKEPFQPFQPFQPSLRRNFSECLSSKHRPWVIKPSQTQNKQVQTDLPILRPNVDVNKRSTLTSTQQQQQQFQQQTNSSSNNTESSLFLKKQESSNFSMFKGMNSNDLFNYIDDVISQFRAKTRLLDDEEDEREREKLSEFSGTIFYPEDQETTTTTTTTGPSLNRDETIDMKRVKRSERLNVHELSTIMSSDDENEIVISSNDDKNFVESKPFSNSKESPNEDIDDDNEDESSTFINYTHSMEIDDESNDDEEDNDETLDDDN